MNFTQSTRQQLLTLNEGYIQESVSTIRDHTSIDRYKIIAGKLYFESETQDHIQGIRTRGSYPCDEEETDQFLRTHFNELNTKGIKLQATQPIQPREKMKAMKTVRVSAEEWAGTLNIKEEEYNELLEELGYQTKTQATLSGSTSWKLTEKGLKHVKVSWWPFHRVVLWDFDTHFQVHKLLGKKRQTHMFCDKCDAYLNHQVGFHFGLKKYVCEECGHVNDTVYASTSLQQAEGTSCLNR